MTLEQWLEVLRPGFPQLTPANVRLASPADERYNCIAWAAGNNERWWWPDAQGQSYWPEGLARAERLEAFVDAFSLLGFSKSTDTALVPGLQKVALYAGTDGRPTHAARQLSDGWWGSKLGQLIDIEHELYALDGPAYGAVAIVLARVTTP